MAGFNISEKVLKELNAFGRNFFAGPWDEIGTENTRKEVSTKTTSSQRVRISKETISEMQNFADQFFKV